MVRDSISELINGMKMASKAKKPRMLVRKSKLMQAVLEALTKEGYVVSVSKKGKENEPWLEVMLNMDKPVLGAKRISTFSKRVYRGFDALMTHGRVSGVFILTTPSGVMSHKDARKAKVGGEVLFKIW